MPKDPIIIKREWFKDEDDFITIAEGCGYEHASNRECRKIEIRAHEAILRDHDNEPISPRKE